MSDEILSSQNNLSELHRSYLSEKGRTITIDLDIGDKEFLGKGLAAPTLMAFTDFYRSQIDQDADTFFIDPDDNNPKAQYVYAKVGKLVREFEAEGKYWDFSGDKTYLMVKSFEQ